MLSLYGGGSTGLPKNFGQTPIQLGSVFGKIVLDGSGAKEGVSQAQTGLQELRADTAAIAGAVAGLTTEFLRLGEQAARAILDIAGKGIELQAKLETAGVTFSQFFGDPKCVRGYQAVRYLPRRTSGRERTDGFIKETNRLPQTQ